MTTMKNALETWKLRRFNDIAQIIVKYQDYKREIVISKMDNTLGKSTRMNYLMYGIRYLKTGYKTHIIPKSLYVALDNCVKTHIQPLRPSADEMKRVHKRDYTRKENNPPVARLNIIQQPVTEKFIYGLKFDDKIILQKNETEAQAFIKGAKFFNNDIDIKLVAVTISEVE